MSRGQTAYIGLGTNLGRRLNNLEEALNRLNRREGIAVTRFSSVYETSPVGYTDQPDFLNMAAELETDFSPRELLRTLLEVEQELHRVRMVRWGPRTLDLDLLLYGDLTMTDEELILPHPRMVERAFVLIPLREIAPEVVIPGTGKTVDAWVRTLEPVEDVWATSHSLRLEQRSTPSRTPLS
ncbi:2-amino-4-hydroxy-6-hydroxymethyldihydropteridine diphosphokinase [Paludifilum halophilum]|uniref:2-amino-4-hydroxy-6-hydroxymethyldihydropteridine diphosphokinase n=1 Tax=Paludifilum halophilum TaxID=1642702 RepID=A0A235B263_9BACL|nr:2-amino-4-hydroxy-6-hydroxymethyldihydropteridine diphosphokinase [Paludifilum halophilum]OYD06332.1 2-amino-4-hydroxy-6-hydroxymethyldihydropteridine diphosphokinase [Paludifilum halophilum]